MKKRYLVVIVFISIIIGTYFLRFNGYIDFNILFTILKEYPILAPFIFVILYILSSVFFIPTLPLNIGSGILWGPFYGALYSFIGSIIGVVICFMIARYFRELSFIKKLDYKSWNWILKKVDKHNWKVVAFVRINPMFPTNIFSYLFGITNISFKVHFFTSFIFLAPLTFIVASFGSSIKDIILLGNIQNIVTGLLILIGSLIFYYILKYILSKIFKINLIKKN